MPISVPAGRRLAIAVLFLLSAAARADWPVWGSDAASTKFAPHDRIHAGNLDSLKILWRYRLPDAERIAENPNELELENHKGTPIVVDGVLYTITPFGIVVALDAATGAERWRYDSRAWAGGSINQFNHRGVAYWSDDAGKARILFGTSADTLYSLDARTGLPDPAFGDDGRVDLTQGTHVPFEAWRHAMSAPPTVIGDVVVVGSVFLDYHSGESPGPFMAPGDVRAYDVRTGAQLWRFETVPPPGTLGYETWENQSSLHFGHANVWASISADPELGLVYLPTSSVSHQQYGGERPGANLFSDCLVAVDARTGQRVWHYQLIHHTMWNYDPPAAPILMDVTVDGEPRKIVVQLTKQAFAYVFDRETGQPIWPIEERPAPPSPTPGERAWPTQPHPTLPAPFDLQGLQPQDLRDFTPELRASAEQVVEPYGYARLFEPPAVGGSIMLPGNLGGADWVGGAADPRTGILYVPSKTLPAPQVLIESQDPEAFSRYGGEYGSDLVGPEGLPVTRPPYGRITAIDMNTGQHLWMRPNGTGPRNHPALRGLDLPEELGWPTRTFLIATPGLLWAVSQDPGSLDMDLDGFFVDREARLRVYDAATGAQLTQMELPDNAFGGPLSYMAQDRQFVVVPTGGADQPAELVALGVPHAGADVPPQAWTGYPASHPAFDDAVAAFDAGDAPALRRLLAQDPGLAAAHGFQHELYPLPAWRGATLLHLTAGSVRAPLPDNVVELAGILLEHGADAAGVTADSTSVLSLAASSAPLSWHDRRLEMVQLLLEHGARPDPWLMWESTVGALGWDGPPAAHFDDLRRLHAAGVPVDLPFAAALGAVDEMDAMVEADGALTPAAHTLGRPTSETGDQAILDLALQYAAFGGSAEAVDWLLDHGAQINAVRPGFMKQTRGMGVLHVAIYGRQTEMVRHLLARGADPQVRELRFDAPAMGWARYAGIPEIIEAIEAAQGAR